MKDQVIRIVCIAQPALVRAYFANDKGDQVFIVCKRGAEFAMKRKLKNRQAFLAEVTLKFVKDLTDEDIKQRRF